MRKTGSRESAGKPRGLRHIAVLNRGKHFLDPFGITTKPAAGPPKIRSITTVSPMIDTIKIGHMIGPPLWNLSINQLLPKRPGSAAGEAAGGAALAAAAAAGLSAPACAGLNVAVTGAPGACGLSCSSGSSGRRWLLRCRLPWRCWLLRCRLPWRHVCSRRLRRRGRICRRLGSRIRSCCRRSLSWRRRLRERNQCKRE